MRRYVVTPLDRIHTPHGADGLAEAGAKDDRDVRDVANGAELVAVSADAVRMCADERRIGADRWKGLARLFESTWFTRVWCIQEISEARDALVLIGKVGSTTWDTLGVYASDSRAASTRAAPNAARASCARTSTGSDADGQTKPTRPDDVAAPARKGTPCVPASASSHRRPTVCTRTKPASSRPLLRVRDPRLPPLTCGLPRRICVDGAARCEGLAGLPCPGPKESLCRRLLDGPCLDCPGVFVRVWQD